MRIMLDTNVIIDLMAVQQPWYQDADQIWKRIQGGADQGYVSASALTDIYYIVRRNLDRTLALAAVQLCYRTLSICAVDQATISRALALPGGDFEDNVVVACAEREDLDAIITRNQKDFAHSSVAVYTPADWLRSGI
jgi:predicted nucleic acid-binding protein